MKWLSTRKTKNCFETRRRWKDADANPDGKTDAERDLETATASSALSARAVGRNGSDIFDTADLHAGTRESPERRLGAGTGSARAHATRGAETNVKGVDAQNFASLGDVLSGQHSGIGGGLVSVGFDLHSSGDATDGFASRNVGHVDKRIVEGGVDVGDTEDVDALFNLRSQLDDLLNDFLLHLSWSHFLTYFI